MAVNDWCDVLGIDHLDLAAVKDHREANNCALLIVALLERGEPMTLPDVAKRFEEVGIAHCEGALRCLKRCKPGRAPVHRDGDHYSLDLYDDELVDEDGTEINDAIGETTDRNTHAGRYRLPTLAVVGR